MNEGMAAMQRDVAGITGTGSAGGGGGGAVGSPTGSAAGTPLVTPGRKEISLYARRLLISGLGSPATKDLVSGALHPFLGHGNTHHSG